MLSAALTGRAGGLIVSRSLRGVQQLGTESSEVHSDGAQAVAPDVFTPIAADATALDRRERVKPELSVHAG